MRLETAVRMLATALLLAFFPGAFFTGAASAVAAEGPQDREEQLFQHRNLGKAFYENPATQYQAVEELKKALDLAPDSARERVNYGLALLKSGSTEEGIAQLERAQKQDPEIPHTWFNLGIAYKQASRYPEAVAQLEGMLRLVPDEAITHYNLGVLYKLQGEADKALHHFERAAALDPDLAGPHFQLATSYRQAGRPEEAKRETALFREIKARNADAAVPEDLEWSWYSEIYETMDPARVAEPGPPAELAFAEQTVARGLDAATAGLVVLDADGDGGVDLAAWSAAGVEVLWGGARAIHSGLEELSGAIALVPGDYDNDGLADLCVVTASGASLYRNAGGRFLESSVELPGGRFENAVWLDYDHDYDVDLFLLGAASRLLRNDGDGTFTDRTESFPFAAGRAAAAVAFDLVSDTQNADLAVVYRDRGGVLYRDLLAGRYEARELAALPALPRGIAQLAARDLNHDGWTDLTAAGAGGVTVLLNDGREGFGPGTVPAEAAAPMVFADLENRGVGELVAGGAVYRNLGLGRFELSRVPPGLPAAVALAAADFDGDGRVDLAAAGVEGDLRLLANRTETGHGWLRVGLTGVKNLRLAPGAEVEVKTGSLYQKRLYDGVPLVFGLGSYAAADAVRITWPNGLIQNETLQSAGTAARYEEAQRLSGSCPMIFTWNGREFQFITDVLGVAPLGASAGDGETFPVDHDEVVQIPGEALVPREGRYEVRVTEELREVAFLDEIRLIAVDHPRGVEIFTNDKFKGPPFPELRLFGVEAPVRPVAARDHRGRDVLERLLARDRTYPDGFDRDYAGVAELHHLELDFGDAAPDNRAVLILSGWVDWADGSTFLGASQGGGPGLVMPQLQVRDRAGRWVTVIEDMGLPAGKPKTIAVDLTGKFLSDSRQVRIVTSLCVYWDEIFLSESTDEPPVRLTGLHSATAELRFRGFSRVVVHPQRKQPERFVYGDLQPLSMWNPTRGLYTRFGEVAPLLAAVDDRLVVMGSGDELRLAFEAGALPEVPAGWDRDFLLFVDGWAKDGDANTAHSQTVGPLPYHGMPQYPYAEPHAFPDDPAYRRYREHYLTRPALRLIRPLTQGPVRAGAGSRPAPGRP